ncbi:MAG: LPS assembly lipoprotein LptE [Gammaproteobacteria bacterium]|nr:MAG: LPS assembly lipoprotein LptE [Gammaproteobacteria bacterium]
MKNTKLTFLILLGFLIISCGFHLRGNQDLSAVLPEVQIQGVNEHSKTGRELVRVLTAAKVSILEESEIILNITRDDFSKRVLSLDSTGRANQYEISYQLDFSLLKKIPVEDKQKLVDVVPAQSITARREYLFDANLVISKADEEKRLNNDMRQAAMLQLIRRLKYSLKSKASVEK